MARVSLILSRFLEHAENPLWMLYQIWPIGFWLQLRRETMLAKPRRLSSEPHCLRWGEVNHTSLSGERHSEQWSPSCHKERRKGSVCYYAGTKGVVLTGASKNLTYEFMGWKSRQGTLLPKKAILKSPKGYCSTAPLHSHTFPCAIYNPSEVCKNTVKA